MFSYCSPIVLEYHLFHDMIIGQLIKTTDKLRFYEDDEIDVQYNHPYYHIRFHFHHIVGIDDSSFMNARILTTLEGGFKEYCLKYFIDEPLAR